MENGARISIKTPTLPIKPPSQNTEEIVKSLRSEPETEEFNENTLVRHLFKELELDGSLSEHSDPFVHKLNTNNECFHCKLTERFQKLMQDIDKVNTEISSIHESTTIKKQQNLELKNTIKRLESSLGKSNDDLSLEHKDNSCSCTSGCYIF